MENNILRRIKGKRGVSTMVGYVLLISMVLVLSAVLYQWMASYVPQTDLECESGISLAVQSATCSPTEINLTLRNTGRFGVSGFYVRGVTATGEKTSLETFIDSDLSGGREEQGGVFIKRAGSLFDNKFLPQEQEEFYFELMDHEYQELEILPIRVQEISGRAQLLSCSSALIRYPLSCESS